jgi:amino acid adenylation domain-containing protein
VPEWVRNLAEILGRTAALKPHREALRCRGQGISYRDLDLRANQLAHILREAGVQNGDRVGILGFKSVQMVAAIQAALRADAVYVPLDARAPESRLGAVCADCGIQTVILDAAASRVVPELIRHGVRMFLDMDDAIPENGARVWKRRVIDSAPQDALPITRGGNDLAYILYTSGSTGRPKGVMLSHNNALTLIRWAARHFGFDETDRILNHTPLTFDLPVCDLYNGFAAGAVIVLVPETDALFPAAVVRTFQEERITSMLLVPSAYVGLMNRGDLLSRNPGNLRRLIYSGEAFAVPQLRRLRAWATTQHICNLYGPIETNACTHFCVADIFPDTHSIPIGKEFDDVWVTIRDEAGRELPAGQEGEICISGGCVMLGYWGDKAQTEARRPALDGRVHYLTGDRGLRRDDGNLLFLGRRDNLVKCRGFRIEIAEVEHAISTHPGVVEAAVVAVPDEEVGNVLYGWFVPASPVIAADEIKEHTARLLPGYMVPKSIYSIPSLPKTNSGKINRLQLAAQIKAGSPEQNGHATD